MSIKVKLVNEEQASKLYQTWGEFARICYNSPKGSEERIGKGCHLTGHYSGSRTTYFIFHIEGVSRALTAQLNRHSVGVVINEKSMRYVDFSEAPVTIPPSIMNNEYAKKIFEDAVEVSKSAYRLIQYHLEQDGLKGEANNQDARYICPIGIQTEGMWAFSLEALEHFMNKRLCKRAQWEIQELAKLMKKEVNRVIPEVGKKLVPHCITLMYCPEGRMTCGLYPTKKQTREMLDILKEAKKMADNVGMTLEEFILKKNI